MLGIEQREFPQHYPQPGWVEQDPEDIWKSQLSVTRSLLQKHRIKGSVIAAIGISNQRETTIVWDKNTGKPVYPAIVWQDKRTSEICDALNQTEWKDYIRENTGLVIDSYFSATKVQWILDHVEGAREKAGKGDLLFGTVDSWLIWKLTGRKVHVTDYSNASRTLLFNIKTLDWDQKLLDLFKIPASMLPGLVDTSGIIAHTDVELFGEKIPIAGVAGDQQAALFGQTCFEPGMAKNTYGTGCFMLMNTGENLIHSSSGLISTIAWKIGSRVEYALEGSVFIAGAAVKWLRDALRIVKSAAETEQAAIEAGDSGQVFVVPAFAGLGAPYWDMHARGAILGLTQGVTDKHIVRATLEAIAYQSKDLLMAMEKDSGINLKSLNVDGGASANNFLMQFQSDILNAEVSRPANIETTALGAAFLAGLSIGFWNWENLRQQKAIERVFVPEMDEETRINLYKGWQRAVARAMSWEQE